MNKHCFWKILNFFRLLSYFFITTMLSKTWFNNFGKLQSGIISLILLFCTCLIIEGMGSLCNFLEKVTSISLYSVSHKKLPTSTLTESIMLFIYKNDIYICSLLPLSHKNTLSVCQSIRFFCIKSTVVKDEQKWPIHIHKGPFQGCTV